MRGQRAVSSLGEQALDAVQGQQAISLELMRRGRDIAAASLLAAERGVDITDGLRQLTAELDAQVAQAEEYVLWASPS